MSGGAASPQVVTLGCRLNIAESKRIAALIAGDPGLVVVNSCAVTAEAVRSTRQAIRRARRDRPDARLLVTGCAADIERAQLSAMPEVDGLVANARKLEARSYGARSIIPDTSSSPATRHTRAFVAIQNGCDHACTFCVIPQGRGPSRSLSIRQALGEIERHLDQRAQEVVLTGVDLTSWGHDLPETPPLGHLVQRILDTFPELRRLRLSSLDGIEIDAHLLDLLGTQERIMPHLHLSLQHGADLILKRMKRRHSRRNAADLVQRLQETRREMTIGADLIAGFPTETAEHHAENLSIIRELSIAHGHVFSYSPRPGTPAARMPQHAKPLIRQRSLELRAEVAAVRTGWLRSLIGKSLEVLAENDGTGHAANFARVALPTGTPPGTILRIVPTRTEGDLLR